jgi:hypothetical protein
MSDALRNAIVAALAQLCVARLLAGVLPAAADGHGWAAGALVAAVDPDSERLARHLRAGRHDAARAELRRALAEGHAHG